MEIKLPTHYTVHKFVTHFNSSVAVVFDLLVKVT
jgi:hypothetical protein